MTSLRERTIRLAAIHAPGSPIRQQLVAILKSARGDWKPYFSNSKVRVQWQGHPDNVILVQELPTRPLKRKLRRRQYDTQYLVQWLHPGHHFLTQNILRDVKLSGGVDYDGVVREVDAALQKAKDDLIVYSAEVSEKYKDSHPGIYQAYTEADFERLRFPEAFAGQDEEVSFLEVEPADYKPVSFQGKGFAGTAEWGRFRFYDEAMEDEYMAQMEGMRDFYKEKSAGGARMLFKLLKAAPDVVSNMTVGHFREWLVKNRIGYDHVPTVWR